MKEMESMKNKDKLILEYAKLATTKFVQGQKTIDNRKEKISDELKMTDEAIIKEAVRLALITFK